MTTPTETDALHDAREEIKRLRGESIRRLCALYDVYHRDAPHPAMWAPDRDTAEEHDRLIAALVWNHSYESGLLADAVGELEELRGCST